MQLEAPTIETHSRRERESKKREVRHLLEDLYRMEPNTVGKTPGAAAPAERLEESL